MASREMLGQVDWHLKLLFAGLFIVNAAGQRAGLLNEALLAIRTAGMDMTNPSTLFGVTAVLSNLVSNVPAVMMLLPLASHSLAGPILALSSTLAGNLFIVGPACGCGSSVELPSPAPVRTGRHLPARTYRTCRTRRTGRTCRTCRSTIPSWSLCFC